MGGNADLVPMLLSKTVHLQLQFMDKMGAKIQVGFHQLYLSLFTLCAVKGFVWFRVLMTRARETETQICLRKKNKNSTSEKQARRAPGACECIYTHLYTEKECIHTCTEEKAYVCFHRKKAPPFPP